MSFRSLLSLSCAAAMLAACSNVEPTGEEKVAEVPTAQLTSTPTPVVADDGSPLTPGNWRVNESANGASASFGMQGQDAQLVITCARDTRVMALTLAGDVQGPLAYVLEAGGTAARLDMVPDGDLNLPSMTAEIAPDAPVFGGFVQPGGVIEISSTQSGTLRLPTSSAIRRVFEACA